MDTAKSDHRSEVADLAGRRLYSIEATAQMLSVTSKHVFALAYSGELATVKLGRRRLVPAEAIDDYIASLKSAAS